MNSFRRLGTPCRIVLSVKRRPLFTNIPIQLRYSLCTRSFICNLHTFRTNSMSQKSITSFFKMTPKKAVEVNKENHEEGKSLSEEIHNRASDNLLAGNENGKLPKKPTFWNLVQVPRAQLTDIGMVAIH